MRKLIKAMKKPKQKSQRKPRPHVSRGKASPLVSVLPNLAQWCEGRPAIIRIFAKAIAVSPEEVTAGMNEIHRREFPDPCPVPDLERWHQCYSHQDIMIDYILRMMFNGDRQIVARVKGIYEAFRVLGAMPPDVIGAILFQMTDAQAHFAWYPAAYFWQDLENRVDRMIVEAEKPKGTPNKETRKLISEPEIRFFARVWAPCWFIHRMKPSELLEIAKNSDMAVAKPALLKLFRIDRSLPLVSPFKELMHRLESNKAKQHDYIQLTNALTAAPIAPAHLPQMKAFAAAPLLLLAKAYKCKLTKNDIRKLYDAIARDRHGRNDLDDSDYDTYRKRMTRETALLKRYVDKVTGTNPSSQKSQ